MESVMVLRISKPRKDGTDNVTHRLVEDAQDAALVVERRQRSTGDETYSLVEFEGQYARPVVVPSVTYEASE
jgi:hypothetical protein